MYRLSSNFSKVKRLAEIRTIPSCHLVTTNSTHEVTRNVTPAMRDPINTGTKYIRMAVTLITTIIGLRLITSILGKKSDESFADSFKSHAFSWPQHYNIFLSNDRLDVNDDDDEISTDDI
ncbi:putative thiamine pyrophosphate-containing protein YdaP [Dirofilaria immitis]